MPARPTEISRRTFLAATGASLVWLPDFGSASERLRSISALGDSMSDLAFFPAAYPRWLASDFPGVKVAALGEAGDSTAKVLGRCRAAGIVDYTVLSRLFHKPLHPVPPGQYCSVLAGVNDLIFLHNTPEAITGHLSHIYSYLRRHDSIPFPITILPYARAAGFRPDRERVRVAVNRWIRSRPHAIDVERLMGDGGNPPALKRSFDGGDGIHPVGEGPKVLARAVAHKMVAYRPRSR